VIIVAACGGTLALGSIGFLREPWQLFAFYMFFGACYGGCGLIPTTTIVTRWFETKRALAMSIASTGLSLGGMILTPVSAFLIQKYLRGGAVDRAGVLPRRRAGDRLDVRSSPRAMGRARRHCPQNVAAQAAAAPIASPRPGAVAFSFRWPAPFWSRSALRSAGSPTSTGS
jgi:MFS family permease